MTYSMAIEDGCVTLPELDFLYRQHYAEMCERLESLGTSTSPYNPRFDEYQRAWGGGWLLNFVLRSDGKPVGYSNVYITNDMHNRDLIAQEDTIFVTKDHRNGIGKKLTQFVLAELGRRGVKKAIMSATTDLRAVKLWKRLGFKELATQMVYEFGEN